MVFVLLFTPAWVGLATAQAPVYPKEIRGYKVERAVVELKKDPKQPSTDLDEDALLRLGDPKLVRATPLGITIEVPIVVSPVKQKGHVDFLVFEDMAVNGTSVEIDEYRQKFDLPNKKPLTLNDPLKLYISLPGAVFTAIDDWSNSKETWPLTGRVYVFGNFNKSIFKFKRCIPVELKMTIPNPLRKQIVR
jgi:hypothetical protein